MNENTFADEPISKYHFHYDSLLKLVTNVLNMNANDVPQLIVLKYCCDVINEHTCSSSISLQLFSNFSHVEFTCIHCGNDNICSLCKHYPTYCHKCNCKTEHDLDWFPTRHFIYTEDIGCIYCQLFCNSLKDITEECKPQFIEVEDITCRIMELGFKFELSRKHEMPAYSNYSYHCYLYQLIFNSFEKGRKLAQFIKNKT